MISPKALLKSVGDGLATFATSYRGYNAIDHGQTRRRTSPEVKSPDALLNDQDRREMMESGRDLMRNFSAASWAVRKHLDYVAGHSFQPLTGNEKFDRQLHDLMTEWSLPENCDAGGRHSLRQMIRTAEGHSVLDGDCFLIKLENGTLAGLEGDRIRNEHDPIIYHDNLPGIRTIHGITLNEMNRPLSYSLYDKGMNEGYVYEYAGELPEWAVLHLAYFEGFDQIRGVSPLASAIDSYADTVEMAKYARLKAKVAQMMAITIYSDDPEVCGGNYDGFKELPQGPVFMPLAGGDRLEFHDSRTPATEFQDFIKLSLEIGMKALDLDYAMFNGSDANFTTSKIVHQNYIKSCRTKRERIQTLLRHITVWKLMDWILTGKLKLPRGFNSIKDIKFEWVPDGQPWFDTKKELEADILAIQNNLKTYSEVRKATHGDDWMEVVRKRQEEDAILEAAGLKQEPPALSPEDQPTEDGDDEGDKKEPTQEDDNGKA